MQWDDSEGNPLLKIGMAGSDSKRKMAARYGVRKEMFYRRTPAPEKSKFLIGMTPSASKTNIAMKISLFAWVPDLDRIKNFSRCALA
jgi:hypothetical protein